AVARPPASAAQKQDPVRAFDFHAARGHPDGFGTRTETARAHKITVGVHPHGVEAKFGFRGNSQALKSRLEARDVRVLLFAWEMGARPAVQIPGPALCGRSGA